MATAADAHTSATSPTATARTPHPMARTYTQETECSSTCTAHPGIRVPSPPSPPAPDVVAALDPASAGGGGPLIRIATAHSQRSAHSANSRPRKRSLFAFTKPEPHPDPELPSLSDDKGECEMTEKDPEIQTPTLSPQDQAAADAAHVYPDGGYGWVVAFCCCTLCALTNGWGMNYGVFQQYYASHTFPTSKTSTIALVGTMQGFTFNLTAFVAGRLGDRFGFRRILCLSAVVCWLGLFTASWSTHLWSTILCQGVIHGFGQGLGMPLFMSLPSQWFYKHRGLASGIAMGGAGIGGGISSIIVRRLLTLVGASRTLLIMSFVNITGSLIAIALIRTRPTSPEARRNPGPIINTSVISHSEFWSIATSLIVAVVGYAGPFYFITQYMTLQFPNLPADSLATTTPLMILSFAVCAGRGLVGLCSDYLGAVNTYILVFISSGVVQLSLWLTVGSYAHACVFAAMYGLVAPGYLGLIPQIVVTLFGPTSLASNVGVLLLFNGPGNLVSGPLGGALFDMTHGTTWKWMIVVFGSLQILGGLTACWARFKTSPRLWSKI